MKKTYFNWSTGKDSALALHKLMQNNDYSVDHLLTSVNTHHDRVTMHGLRRSLMEKQLESIGLPNSTLELPENPSMEEYDEIMNTKIQFFKENGFSHAAFGDIFLEDLKSYRDEKLASAGLKGLYPLWKQDTKDLIEEFIELGFKTIIVSINLEKLPQEFCGRIIDKGFLEDLPKSVDPCGENGEFHTFCFDGPIFNNPVNFKIGEQIIRSYSNPTRPAKEVKYAFQELL